ncbi:MAG: hypothetical protein MMC23_003803 [Stictis urceolatum]|nr:hypothetical protein [Stictis urceolata]
MSWFGSADLATKYAVILFSLLGGVLTAGVIKVCINRRRLKQHEARLAKDAAAGVPFKDLNGNKQTEEGDLFGVRALESGFFGGVAQSQPSSRAASPTSAGPSSRSEYRPYDSPPSNPLSLISKPGSPLSPKPARSARLSPKLHQWPSTASLPKSPLSRAPIVNEHPPLPSPLRLRSQSDLPPILPPKDLENNNGLGIFFDAPLKQDPFADPGPEPNTSKNLPSKPNPSYVRCPSVRSTRSYDTLPHEQPSLSSYHIYRRSRSGERTLFGGDRDSSWDRNVGRNSFDSWRAAHVRPTAYGDRKSSINTVDGLDSPNPVEATEIAQDHPSSKDNPARFTAFSPSSAYSTSSPLAADPGPTSEPRLPEQPTSPLPSTSARISAAGTWSNSWFDSEKTPPLQPEFTGPKPKDKSKNRITPLSSPFTDSVYALDRADSDSSGSSSDSSIAPEENFHVEISRTKHRRVSTRLVSGGPGVGKALVGQTGVVEDIDPIEDTGQIQGSGRQEENERAGELGPKVNEGTVKQQNGKEVRVRVPSKLYEGPASQESAIVEPLALRKSEAGGLGRSWFAQGEGIEGGERSELAAREADRAPEARSWRR